MSAPLCIGFGKRENRCLNDAGSSHSQLWCQECDDERMAHLSRQFEEIDAGFRATSPTKEQP